MKTVIVTGASRGLGLAVCRNLLENSDYFVAGVARQETREFSEFFDQFKDRLMFLSYDLSKTLEIETFFSDKFKEMPPVCGLVSNAAVAYDDLITNLKTSPLETMFSVNVYAPMILSKVFIRQLLLTRSPGSIVHISSVSAHTGYKGLSMYGATKGALESFSRGLAREWGPRGIRSNAVSVGFMETEMSASISADLKEKIYKRTSLGGPVSLDSVAETINFLLSDRARSITGTTISVDCGTL